MVSHYDKIERYENGKWWSFGKLPVRAYGSNLQLPSDWIKAIKSIYLNTCTLEPKSTGTLTTLTCPIILAPQISIALGILSKNSSQSNKRSPGKKLKK